MLQLRNRVRTAGCRLWETSAVYVLTTPSVDVVTVVFHRICLTATATFAERVGESTQTTCVALPSAVREAVWTGQPGDVDVAVFVRDHTVDIVAAYNDTVRTHT